MSFDRLTALEAGYLCFEGPGRPVHIGAVAVFEGGPLVDGEGRLRLDAIRRHVASRLEALPRLRQRLSHPLLGIDRPHWVDDPGFDVAHHVTEARAPEPGDDAALRSVAERLHTAPMDLRSAPWDLHVVTGLAGGRIGLIERVHHALVDGVGGVDLASVLLDLDPDGTVSVADVMVEAPAVAPPPRSGVSAIVPAAWSVLTAPWRVPAALAAPVASAVRHPGDAVRRVATVAGAVGAMVGEGAFASHSPLNAVPGPNRRLAWVRAPLDGVRSAGRDAGATVNDVVLAAVAGGLRELLVSRGEPVPSDLTLTAMVPVSERPDGDHDLGNHVAAMLVPLPVGVEEPAERLAQVTATTRRLKARQESAGTHALLRAADLLPMPLVRTVARAVEHQRFVNLVVTNVPGPPLPLYLLGARMLEAFPVVPLTANLSLGAAILSYDEVLRICLTADTDACHDVDVMMAGIDRDLATLGAHGAPAALV